MKSNIKTIIVAVAIGLAAGYFIFGNKHNDDTSAHAYDYEGGYWLSTEKEIRNPYFGDKMLECGKVTQTIK